MGNVVRNGEHNNDLVDILKYLGYIQTKKIELVFRAVDRGDYVLAAHREGAYKDLSWKIGNIHLSAPCVYGTVMEGLSLQSGLSFLNMGSGTGYLNTMAGLILNHHGTNHGIELNRDCLDYAYEKLEEFKQKSLALDEFDFCEPVFMHGNCLKLESNRQYDRVYCGAACPESHETFIKQFVKIGGVLVMPYKENLLRIERIDKDTWRHKAMLPVSFASLVLPIDDDQRLLQLPISQPLALQELSRSIIRYELRELLWKAYPELQFRDLITPDRNKPSYYNPVNTRLPREDENDVDSDMENIEILSPMGLRSIVLSVTNENLLHRFNSMSDNSSEESLKIKNCETINTTQSITATDSPSTSYHSNLFVNTINDNDDKSLLTKKIINTKIRNDQSSAVNIDEKTNKLFQSDSDIDDSMEFDVQTVQLKNNKIKSNDLNENSNGDETINSDTKEHSVKASEHDTLMNNGNSNEGDDVVIIDYDYDNDNDENDEDETSVSMDWLNAIQRYQDRWGPPMCEYSGDDHLNNYAYQSGLNDINRQDLPCSQRYRQVFSHNVDVNVFSAHMKDKISKLPLPISLLMYINYNRNF